MLTPRALIMLASAFGLVAVAAGAFGAHGLKKTLTPEMLTIFETGARYNMYHALALLGAAWLLRETGNPLAVWAGVAFTFGILIFSGTLYALAITGTRWLGAITPIGGVGLMVGWLLMLVTAARSRF